jgi:cyclic-di-GMP-binding protein
VSGVTFREIAFPYTGRLSLSDDSVDASFMDQSLAVRLTAPEAELDLLSFCDPDPISLADWVASLPMANTADTATHIRQATFEIARLTVDFRTRMELLESLRPSLHYLSARLDQTATSTNTHGDAIARLAQRLQTNLCSGYKAVILTALAEKEDRRVREIISLSIHRALSDLSRTLLRTLQFYVDPADRLWLELNQLYCLAEKLGMEEDAWIDQENHSRTETNIRDAYLRSILLALSKPNQLRHRQLAQVFNALELWSPSVRLVKPDGSALFCIDLDCEQGPRYQRLMDNPLEPRCLHTEDLVWELEAFVKDLDGSLPMPDQFPVELVRHLADAWGVMRQRSFNRAATTSAMKVCVGIRAAHYFLSGAVDFADQLDRTDSVLNQEVNPFLEREATVVASTNKSEIKDVWDDAFDLRVKIPVNPNIENPEQVPLREGTRPGIPVAVFTSMTRRVWTPAPVATGSAGMNRYPPTSRPERWLR